MAFKKYLNIENYIGYIKYHFGKRFKESYSQCGEDLLINCAGKEFNLTLSSYLDIGANHPILNNNTYLFYKKGSRGVCVEPDCNLFKIIKKERNDDVCLNVGIGPTNNSNADYYIMSSGALNTFDKNEAEKCARSVNYGKQNIKEIKKIPLVTINAVIEKYFSSCPDLISLDTEGYDFEIIRSLDFKEYNPKIICVETARYDEEGKIEKRTDIISYLEKQNYLLYADTYVNSIFVTKNIPKRAGNSIVF